eukprot:7317810-Alexandrium_andersonii.AAC.1
MARKEFGAIVLGLHDMVQNLPSLILRTMHSVGFNGCADEVVVQFPRIRELTEKCRRLQESLDQPAENA